MTVKLTSNKAAAVTDDLAFIVRNAIAYIKVLEAELARCKQVCAAPSEAWRKEAALAEPVEPAAWIHTDPDKPRVKFLEGREDEPGYRGRWGKTPLYTAPPRCPNCASLEDQNTELDRKLAEMERKLFELQAAVFRSQGIRCSDVGT